MTEKRGANYKIATNNYKPSAPGLAQKNLRPSTPGGAGANVRPSAPSQTPSTGQDKPPPSSND